MSEKKIKKTQMSMIREHLRTKGTITSMEAIKLYGCTRLSAKIFNLKQAGWEIDSLPTPGTNRYGETTVFSTYRFVSEPERKEKTK